MGDIDVKADGVLQRGLPRRDVLRGSTAAAVGISAMMLPAAAQAFSLTSAGVPIDGVTVYWSEGTRIGRLVYRGLDAGVDTIDNGWLTELTDARKILIDGGFLYYVVPFAGGNASLQGIWRVNIADKAAVRVVAADSLLGFDIEGDDLYYARSSDGVYRIAKDGSGSATSIVSISEQLFDVAVLDDRVIVTEITGIGEGRLLQAPKAGGGTATLFANVPFPRKLDVSGGTVFVTTASNRIYRLQSDGSAAGNFFVGNPTGIQVLDSTVFVSTSAPGALRAMGPDGGNQDEFARFLGTPQTLLSNQTEGVAVVPA